LRRNEFEAIRFPEKEGTCGEYKCMPFAKCVSSGFNKKLVMMMFSGGKKIFFGELNKVKVWYAFRVTLGGIWRGFDSRQAWQSKRAGARIVAA
jgi:hypothetical protein